MDYYIRSPEPYQPGTGCYLEDLDGEVDFQILDSRRPGSMDTKVLALFRDGYRCRKCGTTVAYEDSEADHIEPVNRFASFRQANFPTNVQILCQDCHRERLPRTVEKYLESRMQGNLHVRFGVGAGERSPAYTTRKAAYLFSQLHGWSSSIFRPVARRLSTNEH